MPRIRTVKPEFWVDEKVVELSPWARLLFIGLWNFADDQGYADYSPKRIRMQVFPGDAVDIDALIGELLARGQVRAYESPAGPVLHIVNWTRHQRIDKPGKARFAADDLRPFPSAPVAVPDHSQNVPGVLPEPSQSPREVSGAERKGREGEGKGKEVPPSAGALALRHDATVTQRSKRITDAYAAVEPMCKWPAINGVVIKAIKSEKFTDDEIRDALLRLAAEGRSVTVETLRVELAGMPPSSGARASTTDQRVAEGLALAARLDSLGGTA